METADAKPKAKPKKTVDGDAAIKKKAKKKAKRKSNDGDAKPPPAAAAAPRAAPPSPTRSVQSTLQDEKAAYRNTNQVMRPVEPSMIHQQRAAPPRTSSSESGKKKLKKQGSKKKLKKSKTSGTGTKTSSVLAGEASSKAAARKQRAAGANATPLAPPSRGALGESAAAPTDLNREVSQPGAYRTEATGSPPPARQMNQQMGVLGSAPPPQRRMSNDPELGDTENFEDEGQPTGQPGTTDDGDFLVTATLVEEPNSPRQPPRSGNQSQNYSVDPNTKMMTVDAKLLTEDSFRERRSNDNSKRICIIGGVVCCLCCLLIGGLVGILVALGVFGGSSDDGTSTPTLVPSAAPVTSAPINPVPTPAPNTLAPSIPTSPTTPIATSPPWWDEFGSHPVYSPLVGPPSPLVQADVFGSVFAEADYFSVFFVQWGYVMNNCEGMITPPRLELSCGGASGASVHVLDEPDNVFCMYNNNEDKNPNQRSFREKFCSGRPEDGSGWDVASDHPNLGFPDIAFEFQTVLQVVCTYKSIQPQDEVHLTAIALPFEGDSCGEELADEPGVFFADVSTGLAMSTFCYEGSLTTPPNQFNLLYEPFEPDPDSTGNGGGGGTGDGLTSGICNPGGEKRPLPKISGGLLREDLYACATGEWCEGDQPCDPSIRGPVTMRMTATQPCHLPLAGLGGFGDTNDNHPLNALDQSMEQQIEERFTSPTFAEAIHEKAFPPDD